MDEKKLRLIRKANEAYEAGDYDRYEEMVERGQRMFGGCPGSFEDDVTDVRLLGEEAA